VSPATSMGPGGGRGDLLEAGPVPGDGLGGVLGQVMPQVQRSATWTAAGVPSRAPSAWAPARQHIVGSPGGSAGQDGGVDVAVAQREVIDADHVRHRTGHRVGQAEDQPQQRAAEHRDSPAQRPAVSRPAPPARARPGTVTRPASSEYSSAEHSPAEGWPHRARHGHRGTVSNCDEVSVPLQWFCRLGDRTNNV
jgi:hypothetical protein